MDDGIQGIQDANCVTKQRIRSIIKAVVLIGIAAFFDLKNEDQRIFS